MLLTQEATIQLAKSILNKIWCMIKMETSSRIFCKMKFLMEKILHISKGKTRCTWCRMSKRLWALVSVWSLLATFQSMDKVRNISNICKIRILTHLNPLQFLARLTIKTVCLRMLQMKMQLTSKSSWILKIISLRRATVKLGRVVVNQEDRIQELEEVRQE